MLQIDVRTNAREIAAAAKLDAVELARATVSSLNRAADGLRTDAVRRLASDYNVTQKELRRAFTVMRATRNAMVAIVRATGRPLRVIAFDARQTSTGVSVSIKKGQRKTIEHAFIARMRSGHTGVFRRAQYVRGKEGRRMRLKKKEAIFETYTVSVPGMLGAKQIEEALRTSAIERFEKAMDQNIRYLRMRRNG